eukprot:CAMPEP_0204614212 /NCGR_PEP_ID=MMETSP0717-20131115/1984_1 /ASSEMBLY_ACC=CAM_ASM_000666 /TAXON_ID=230516 /ORGANISM="Chaetoceros curvisetus" /LENGTH=256 /DNA_ID=CAMNT_0051626825 /DNA_START=21 /DNA_END=791 /DNA_ORIENTATION=+
MTAFLISGTNGFSAKNLKPLSSVISRAESTKMHSHAMDAEDDAMYMMMKASACAHSDACSIDEAENYLNEVLHLQSDCVSGALTSDQICDDVIFPSEVIGALRNKIESGQSSLARQLNPTPYLFAASAAYILVGLYALSQNPGVEPFTAQEYLWSIRDGYFGDMIMQTLKHGGLRPVEDAVILPFTPQEWWWALRDGYVFEMMEQSAKNGGLVVDASSVNDIDLAYNPFLPEEWGMAVRDGYLSDMISHYMRNGGL